MKLGLIGLGKMGIHLAQNMLRHDNEVVGFDRSPVRQVRCAGRH